MMKMIKIRIKMRATSLGLYRKSWAFTIWVGPIG